jgi:hypothetical protein
MSPTREFADRLHREQCISLGTGAASGLNLTGVVRIPRQFTQPLDGNNAGAHPVSRDIAQASHDVLL